MKLAVILGLWLAVFATAIYKEPNVPNKAIKTECKTFECRHKRTE